MNLNDENEKSAQLACAIQSAIDAFSVVFPPLSVKEVIDALDRVRTLTILENAEGIKQLMFEQAIANMSCSHKQCDCKNRKASNP